MDCHKVFYDPKGHRWLRVKIITFGTLFFLGLNIFFLWPSFVNSSSPGAIKCCEDKASIDYPARLAYSGDLNGLPIIGEGHLERVMEVQDGELLVEPFTREKRPLKDTEKAQIKEKKFVIEKYGKATGKYISITFDDGPDPKYTPQILDLLAKEKVQATFFITGENAARYPEIVKRIAAEGHIIGNHTFSHIDFDNYSSFRDRQEVITTDRVIRSLTGRQAKYFRIPYNGGVDDEKSMRDNVRGMLQAQQLGFEVVSFNYDSFDWDFQSKKEITISPLLPNGNIVLLHDSGGDRSNTIIYLEGLIKKGKTEKFSFATLEHLSEKTNYVFTPIKKSPIDNLNYLAAKILFVFPDYLMYVLFIIAAFNIIVFTVMNMILALLNKRKIKKMGEKKINTRPLVSMVIAAYNEELVIEKTIRSIMHSNYKKLEVIVVDDGSTDRTKYILQKLAKEYKRLSFIAQRNTGKASALNNGIKFSKGEIVVTADADTILLPNTIRDLVKHFSDPKIGAVAGFVKVGNMGNLITCWQAMEYVAGISLERFAHSFFGAIMITPGACGAWRKRAILEAGGYSSDTLAEDCDLTLKIQKAGYKTVTDLAAIGLTEAPKTIHDLLKQRFRWMFGNLQVFWKHRDMILNPRYGFLGLFILPQSIFAVLIQLLFLPFTYIMIIDHFIAGEVGLVVGYFLALVVFQFIISTFAIWISKEKYSNLIIVPVYRLIAEPLRAFLLYSSFISILKGRMIGWNKVKRLGEVEITL